MASGGYDTEGDYVYARQSVITTADVQSGDNKWAYTVRVQTQTGMVTALTIEERGSGDVVARLHIPDEAAMVIGQALMLAQTIHQAGGQ